jgi:hypothetical protein
MHITLKNVGFFWSDIGSSWSTHALTMLSYKIHVAAVKLRLGKLVCQSDWSVIQFAMNVKPVAIKKRRILVSLMPFIKPNLGC